MNDMLFPPKPLSSTTLSPDDLAADKKAAVRFDRCALGKRAVYVGSFGLSRNNYVPLEKVSRVFKRLAVSKGFYEGKVYGTLAYIVVVYDDGKEAVCRFEKEEILDEMLALFKSDTNIPVGKA